MIRTSLYLRCSSVEQIRHGFSIPDQLARLRAEAKAAGEQIVAEFIDQARSGTSAARRREYQRLLAAARGHEFDRVRVESVDRGHRNDTERRLFEDELGTLGIQVVYSGELEKQPPQYRKFNRAMRGVVAELESDETSQRTYKRQLYRAKKGKWRGGTIPYGLLPDGNGWFVPDPETYPALCWILEQRAEGLGYHRIARLINNGIQLEGKETHIPITPAMRLYLRKPYREYQDPETGEVIHLERPMPDVYWQAWSIREICEGAVDGVYAGILRWGQKHNRFGEDAEGNPKQPVIVDTGRPLIDLELLQKLQARKHDIHQRQSQSRTDNQFLLAYLLYCGHCGRTVPGYTSTQNNGKRQYSYRKYRCNGRTARPGSCTLTILDAETLEQIILNTLFAESSQVSPRVLRQAVNGAIEQRREELTRALETLGRQRTASEQQRDELLDRILQVTALTPLLQQALVERTEAIIQKLAEIKGQQDTLRIGIQSLDTQARTIGKTLQQADVDTSRWQEPAVRIALQCALRLMVRRIEVTKQAPRQYTLEIWLPDAGNLLFREFEGSEGAEPASHLKPPHIWYNNKPIPILLSISSVNSYVLFKSRLTRA